MPCHDSQTETDREEAQERADAATRAACDLRTILRRGGTEQDLTVVTREWIARHDAWDAKRIKIEEASGERERVRQQALNKLNLDERRALGL
jgi:hypothetical protein